jgi:hypothetical protein
VAVWLFKDTTHTTCTESEKGSQYKENYISDFGIFQDLVLAFTFLQDCFQKLHEVAVMAMGEM